MRSSIFLVINMRVPASQFIDQSFLQEAEGLMGR